MAFSEEDKIVITFLRQNKHYGAKDLIRKIDLTGTSKRRMGSGSPRTERKTKNIEQVSNLVSSQEDRPQSHLTLREIAREIDIARTSVHEIVKKTSV